MKKELEKNPELRFRRGEKISYSPFKSAVL